MATTTITLNSGTFDYKDSAIKVTGNLTVNDKDINNINGQVMDGEINLGSFDAYRGGESLQFNLHPTSISVAAQLASAVGAAVEAVENEL